MYFVLSVTKLSCENSEVHVHVLPTAMENEENISLFPLSAEEEEEQIRIAITMSLQEPQNDEEAVKIKRSEAQPIPTRTYATNQVKFNQASCL